MASHFLRVLFPFISSASFAGLTKEELCEECRWLYPLTHTGCWFSASASSGVGNCHAGCYNVVISPLLLHLTSVFVMVYNPELPGVSPVSSQSRIWTRYKKKMLRGVKDAVRLCVRFGSVWRRQEHGGFRACACCDWSLCCPWPSTQPEITTPKICYPTSNAFFVLGPCLTHNAELGCSCGSEERMV